MTEATATESWESASQKLRQWHESRDRDAARSALSFIESELRLMVPVLVRRTWSHETLEDGLRDFLLKMIESPLPDGIRDLRRYLARAFRNHCIDLHEARGRRSEIPIDELPGSWEAVPDEGASLVSLALQEEQRRHIQAAVLRLETADRIVLKLEHAPEWLDDDELLWLASRAATTVAAVRAAVTSADDMHALTRVFDPADDDPDDAEVRRKRMERFRRRRARAREKLRAFLQEER